MTNMKTLIVMICMAGLLPLALAGDTPAAWAYTTSYVYALNAPSGTHQPTLTGAKPDSNYCISMAAFKIAPAVAVPQ